MAWRAFIEVTTLNEFDSNFFKKKSLKIAIPGASRFVGRSMIERLKLDF